MGVCLARGCGREIQGPSLSFCLGSRTVVGARVTASTPLQKMTMRVIDMKSLLDNACRGLIELLHALNQNQAGLIDWGIILLVVKEEGLLRKGSEWTADDIKQLYNHAAMVGFFNQKRDRPTPEDSR